MSNRPDVGLGPRLLAIETALRALVDQASSTDSALRDRIRAAAEAYLVTIPQVSELEREFTEQSRGFVESIVRPPTV